MVTKTDMRWVRSDVGTVAPRREVAALRCGLDFTAWHDHGGQRCGQLLGIPLDKTPGDQDPLWRSAFSEATEGNTVTACLRASQAIDLWSLPLGGAVTSTCKGRLVSGPEGTTSRCLPTIMSSTSPNSAW